MEHKRPSERATSLSALQLRPVHKHRAGREDWTQRTFRTAEPTRAAACSTSSCVVMKDREKRREERTASSDNPMAVSTWEGIGCSVWQADPAEHSRPAGSSNSISASAVHPSNARLEVLGIRSVPPECTVTPPTCVRRRDSKESRIRDSRPASSSKCLNAARAAAPKPMIPGTFSVPDLKPYSCPPPNS